MDINEINEKYGNLLWSVAKRYHTGIWETEDVFNELILLVYEGMDCSKLSDDGSVQSFKTIRSFVISRAINIIKRENRRKNLPLIKENLMCSDMLPQINDLMDLIQNSLSRTHYLIIKEFLFPSVSLQTKAIKKQQIARKKRELGSLKMNVNGDPRIFKQLIADEIGVSPATVSRAFTETKGIYIDLQA